MAQTVDLGALPDSHKVEALAGFGLSAADIGRIFEVEVAQVEAAFAKELAAGEAKANARVAENLYRKATGEGREAVTAAIFWLKTRARWKEMSKREDVADTDSPITFKVVYEAKPG